MQEIRSIAKTMGIKTSRLSKVALIRQIQETEGNYSCFATAEDQDCDQTGCCWREDCFAAAKKLAN